MLTVVMIFSLTACSTGFLSDNDMLNVPEDKNPVVTFTLEYDNNDGLGKRIVELSYVLYYNKAPSTVANFVQLVQSGYYKNKIIHSANMGDGSVENLSYITGGQYYIDENDQIVNDKKNYYIKGEFEANQWDKNDMKHVPGVLAMDRMSGSGAVFDTASTAFYMVFNENVERNGNYCVFGEIVSSKGSLNGGEAVVCEGLWQRFVNDMFNVSTESRSVKDGGTLSNVPEHSIVFTNVTVETFGIDYSKAKVAKM